MYKSINVLGYGKSEHVLPLLELLGGKMATPDELKSNTTLPVIVSGTTKRIVPNTCYKNGVPWYSIDGGYLGNADRKWKRWFRFTANAWQNSGPIIPRDETRLNRITINQRPIPRGRRIMLVPPHPKVVETFGLPDVDTWIKQTVELIRQHTNREVVTRDRPGARRSRRFREALQDDINAVVVYNSNAGVESVVHGIPVVALGDCGSTPMSHPIHRIDDLDDVDIDRRHSWLKHLSYCQFTMEEIRNGTAWSIVNE